MNVERYAKALTAMEAGVGAIGWIGDEARGWEPDVIDPKLVHPLAEYMQAQGYNHEWGRTYPTPTEALAAACEALDLPWQQHPVWLMYKACGAALGHMPGMMNTQDIVTCAECGKAACSGSQRCCKNCARSMLQNALKLAKGGG